MKPLVADAEQILAAKKLMHETNPHLMAWNLHHQRGTVKSVTPDFVTRGVTASRLIPNKEYHGHTGALVAYLWTMSGTLMGEIAWNKPWPCDLPRSVMPVEWLVPNNGEPLVPMSTIDEEELP